MQWYVQPPNKQWNFTKRHTTHLKILSIVYKTNLNTFTYASVRDLDIVNSVLIVKAKPDERHFEVHISVYFSFCVWRAIATFVFFLRSSKWLIIFHQFYLFIQTASHVSAMKTNLSQIDLDKCVPHQTNSNRCYHSKPGQNIRIKWYASHTRANK